ncbi:TDP-N-acetylfucosamine:lipid II N-acetylfucosaminyltransferase [Desulfosporosinus sp.]|uniref:TDP-N-acetylfucosamine:lipid II N-acetylfucosaminyltransferase n=1 Tax=Desulfosporosinus sp. TaxID=157907 RepID=UPI0025C52A9F|nr:TDP-N-acetylfucosamine:lipid II N-acetylfucosaminyltransferase [Desulfosporosinus sp.]MBC2726061.1 TDP-N-acetylfucosamine:lipid II N-acetylfucosaminyltransferase [Desulfosporosinus sp.]
MWFQEIIKIITIKCICGDSMKNVHIFPSTTFLEPYIEFISKNFDSKEHLFLIPGKGIEVKITPRDNVVQLTRNTKSFWRLIYEMNKSEKVFLHNLFNVKIVFLLFFQPWLLRKCNWVVWGGDLYYYKSRKKTLKSAFYEKFRGYVIKNIGGLITHIKGDYELAKFWYGAKGKYYYCFMYPSNLYKEYNLDCIKNESKKIIILIGNSANPSNNHLEIFEKIKKYKEYNLEIICPLSYDNTQYRDQVISRGKEIFGEKFRPLIVFIPFNEYLDLLAQVDVAIFNHKRQQAMGNITTLLGLGKKVYVRDDITTWEFFIEHGLKVFNSNSDFDDLFEDIGKRLREANMENVKNKFSVEKLRDDWEQIFNSGAIL